MMRGRALWALAACYVLTRVLLVAHRQPNWDHGDTSSYQEGVSFIGNAPRMWLIPLLLELPGRMVVIVQALLGGAAFVALAVALSTTINNRRLRIVLAALILAIGLSPRITLWDTMMLSESVAISLTALLIAALADLRRIPVWAFAAVFTLWLFTRDGHTYLGAMLAIGLVFRGWKQRSWQLPAVCVVALAWNVAAANNNQYVEGSTAAAGMAYYSLVDHKNFDWLRDHGMPDSDGFRYADRFDDKESVTALFQHIKVFRGIYFADPDFRAWADRDGQALYLRFLSAHPGYIVERLPNAIVDGGFVDDALVDHSASKLETTAGLPWVWPREASWYTFLLGGAAALASLWAAREGRLDRRWLVPGLIAASSVPHAWMALIASPYEYGRHGLIMAFTLVVACWWMVALAADVTIGRSHARLAENEVGAGREDGVRSAR